MISKILQILGFQPRISKVFLDHWKNFLTVGQNNFGKKNINFVSKIILTFYHWNKKILTVGQNNFWNKIPFLIFHNIYQIWSLPTRTLPCLLFSWGLQNADDTNTNNNNNLVVESVILMGSLSTHWMIIWMDGLTPRLTHFVARAFFTVRWRTQA